MQGYLKYPPIPFAVLNESPQDLIKGGRQLIIRCVKWVVRVEFTCTDNLKYPPTVQVHNESHLYLIEEESN